MSSHLLASNETCMVSVHSCFFYLCKGKCMSLNNIIEIRKKDEQGKKKQIKKCWKNNRPNGLKNDKRNDKLLYQLGGIFFSRERKN